MGLSRIMVISLIIMVAVIDRTSNKKTIMVITMNSKQSITTLTEKKWRTVAMACNNNDDTHG